jgi:hypothetical protein
MVSHAHCRSARAAAQGVPVQSARLLHPSNLGQRQCGPLDGSKHVGCRSRERSHRTFNSPSTAGCAHSWLRKHGQIGLDYLRRRFVSRVRERAYELISSAAHHCVQNHPANLILAHFYLPVVRNGGRKHLPGILGLSASPVMKAAASTDALR